MNRISRILQSSDSKSTRSRLSQFTNSGIWIQFIVFLGWLGFAPFGLNLPLLVVDKAYSQTSQSLEPMVPQIDPLSMRSAPDPSEREEPSTSKVFGDVEIKIRDIFDPPTTLLYKLANDLKIKTKKSMVMQEVQFKKGAPYDPFLVYETERLLRQLRYLRDARVIPIDRGKVVDVRIEVQDTWTIIPQMSFSSGDGRTRRAFGFSEGNLLGYGNRAEVLFQDNDGADTLQAAFDSRRLFGTKYQGQLALEHGAEGEQFFYDFGDPFRSLAQDNAWSHQALFSDTIERQFIAGTERFIYRKKTTSIGASYAFAVGDPRSEIRRFSLGLSYLSDSFRAPTAQDYKDVSVDPADLRPEGGELADDRKFVGPVLSYQYIEQDFIRRNYVDRFSRVEDFNLGQRFESSAQLAPAFLGSHDDAFLLRAAFGEGYRLRERSFARWEMTLDTRLLAHGFENSIFSLEGQYISPFGPVEWGNIPFGNHTLLVRSFVDYSFDLDPDREFLAGGDNILRGYDARTFSGDKRFALNIEDRVHIVDNLYDFFSLGMSFFVDIGGATHEPIRELFTDEMYSDVGFGLRVGFPRSNGERVVRIDVAAPLRDGLDGSSAWEFRIIFSGGQLFGSQLGTERLLANRVGVDLGF